MEKKNKKKKLLDRFQCVEQWQRLKKEKKWFQNNQVFKERVKVTYEKKLCKMGNTQRVWILYVAVD